MALPPVICDEKCHNRRINSYLFHTAFLTALVLLALLHFIFFLSTRRKSKYEARDYATRKLEFVSGIPDLLPPTEKENAGRNSSTQIDEETHPYDQTNVMMSPEPSTSAVSMSALNRMLEVNGMGSVPLHRIDEESTMMPRDAVQINRCSTSSSASTIRDRALIGALQEPVIVTVATVSALFQQHDINEPIEQRSRSHSSESMSSVFDISDLVNSPGRSITVRAEDAADDVSAANIGDLIAGTEFGDGFHTKHQMLDVRIGGGKGGYLKSHRGDQLRKGDAASNDMFPTSG